MDAKRRQKVIYLLFGLAVIYGFYNLFTDFGRKNQVSVPSAQEQSAHIIAQTVNTIDVEKYLSLEWGRDPFYRPKAAGAVAVAVQNQPEVWILSGILYDQKTPTAIINRKIVGIGDKIDGARIVSITRSEVVIRPDNSSLRTLIIKKEKS